MANRYRRPVSLPPARRSRRLSGPSSAVLMPPSPSPEETPTRRPYRSDLSGVAHPVRPRPVRAGSPDRCLMSDQMRDGRQTASWRAVLSTTVRDLIRRIGRRSQIAQIASRAQATPQIGPSGGQRAANELALGRGQLRTAAAPASPIDVQQLGQTRRSRSCHRDRERLRSTPRSGSGAGSQPSARSVPPGPPTGRSSGCPARGALSREPGCTGAVLRWCRPGRAITRPQLANLAQQVARHRLDQQPDPRPVLL